MRTPRSGRASSPSTARRKFRLPLKASARSAQDFVIVQIASKLELVRIVAVGIQMSADGVNFHPPLKEIPPCRN